LLDELEKEIAIQNNEKENELDEQETIVKLTKFILKFIYNSIYQLLIYISYFNRNLVIHQTIYILLLIHLPVGILPILHGTDYYYSKIILALC